MALSQLAIPPRSTGTADPAGDMNAVVGKVNQLVAAVNNSVSAAPTLSEWLWTSQNGCVSDADISQNSTTYGTDNTAPLQAILNAANANQTLYVIWDGRYSHTGLTVYSNTKIVYLPGCGQILRPNSNVALMANPNQSYTTTADFNIHLDGGTHNHNGYTVSGNGAVTYNQVHDKSGYDFVTGFRWHGVKNISMRNFQLFNPRTYSAHFACNRDVVVENFRIDVGAGAPINCDGIHFNCDQRNVVVRGGIGRTNDDFVAVSGGDWKTDWPGIPAQAFTQEGILIEDIFLEDSLFGIAIRGGQDRQDNIVVRNIRGRTTGYALVMDANQGQPSNFTLPGPGNVGTVTLEDINVQCTPFRGAFQVNDCVLNISNNIERLILKQTVRDKFAVDNFPTLLLSNNHTIGSLEVYGYTSNESAGGGFVTSHLKNNGCTINNLLVHGAVARRTYTSNGSALFENAAGTVTNLQLAGVYASALDNIVKVTGGSVNYQAAASIMHDNASSGAASFYSTVAVTDIVLSNYRGAVQTGGGGYDKATKRGDGFGTTASQTTPTQAGQSAQSAYLVGNGDNGFITNQVVDLFKGSTDFTIAFDLKYTTGVNQPDYATLFGASTEDNPSQPQNVAVQQYVSNQNQLQAVWGEGGTFQGYQKGTPPQATKGKLVFIKIGGDVYQYQGVTLMQHIDSQVATINTNPAKLTIGYNNNHAGRGYACSLAEVVVYNRAWTNDELTAYVNTQAVPSDAANRTFRFNPTLTNGALTDETGNITLTKVGNVTLSNYS